MFDPPNEVPAFIDAAFRSISAAMFLSVSSSFAVKDSQQEKEIKHLYAIHDADCARLRDLELKLAGEYHSKPEMHDILNDLKTYLKERFDKIEGAIYEKRRSGNDHL